jgi:hypothetical protein
LSETVDALSSLLFNFFLKYAIRYVQEGQEGFELTVTNQLLVSTDYDNAMGENTNTVK